MIRENRVNGTLLGWWDTTSREYTDVSRAHTSRPFSSGENAIADGWEAAAAIESAFESMAREVTASSSTIQRARDDMAALVSALSGFVPKAAYDPSQLGAIAGMVSQVAQVEVKVASVLLRVASLAVSDKENR